MIQRFYAIKKLTHLLGKKPHFSCEEDLILKRYASYVRRVKEDRNLGYCVV